MTEGGNGLPELPQGWIWTTVGEIAGQVNPGFPSGKHNVEGKGVPHLRPMNISRKGEIDFSLVKYVEVSDYDALREGDVLFNNTNSPALLGKTTYIKKDTSWAYSNHMTRIRLHSGPSPAWVAYSLYYLFVTGYFRMHCRHHVNQASINTGFLSERVPIRFPPLPEQHRIVAKIEELFTQLDAGVAALEKAKAQLRRYRQAVLKAAVEGELTREWREAHREELESASVLLERIRKGRKKQAKKKRTELPPLDTSDLPELPEEWVWTSISDIGKVIGGLTKNRKRTDYPLQMPYLRVANVYADELRLDDVKTIGVRESELERLLLEKGDMLVVEGNGSIEQIGRVALWDGSISPCVHQNHIIKVRFSPVEVGEYALYWLLSNDGREQIVRVASSTSGLYTLSLSKVSALPVPFPPLSEQRMIVEEIERCLSVADELEKAVEQSLKRAERLRQSILKRAFEGKLVPQDPSDGPASVLLERIKAEKARREAERTGGKRSRKKRQTRQLELL